MGTKLLRAISPNDIDTSSGFMGTGFNKSEHETLACNFVVIYQRLGGWTPIDFVAYLALCAPRIVPDSEWAYIQRMAQQGWFEAAHTGDKFLGYLPSNRFIGAIAEYIKE